MLATSNIQDEHSNAGQKSDIALFRVSEKFHLYFLDCFFKFFCHITYFLIH